MASVNKVIVIGNLGRDPEVRYTPDGAAVCNIAVATTSTWKDKTSGEKMEETEWHRITFYNRLAEIAGEYLKKGRQVYIEGRLKTRKWQDKDTGADRFTTEIIADQMQMLGTRDDGGGQQQERQAVPQQQRSAPRPSAPRQAAQGGNRPAPAPSSAPNFADTDDDIPF